MSKILQLLLFKWDFWSVQIPNRLINLFVERFPCLLLKILLLRLWPMIYSLLFSLMKVIHHSGDA